MTRPTAATMVFVPIARPSSSFVNASVTSAAAFANRNAPRRPAAAPEYELRAATGEAGAERRGREDEEAEHVCVLAARTGRRAVPPSARGRSRRSCRRELTQTSCSSVVLQAALQVRSAMMRVPEVDGGKAHPQAGAREHPPFEVTTVSAIPKKLILTSTSVSTQPGLVPGGWRGWRSAASSSSLASGATVRLTGSGLGCPHWPTLHEHARAAEGLPLEYRVCEPRRVGAHGLLERSPSRSPPGGLPRSGVAAAGSRPRSSPARLARRRSARSPSTTT